VVEIINDVFKGAVASNTGCAVIFAGSGSDDEHIGKIVKGMDTFGIPHDVRICSAHKQPDELYERILEYNSLNGALAMVAVAGGTDALSGTLSFLSVHPVISCPPDAPNQSCLTNPPGSSNLYLARAGDVGRAVAQMYSYLNLEYRRILQETMSVKIRELQNADGTIGRKYRGEHF